MAGHSKWSNIKHRKGAQDAKRGKIFTKLIREITVASRLSGEDLSANPRLRSAVDAALSQNMPRDTINRAIQRGSGSNDSDNLEEIRYEGYGPQGVAIIVDCLSDNRKRTVSEVRHAFSKHGGNLGTDGSVAYLFDNLSQFVFNKNQDEEKLMELALDAGAEDVITQEDGTIEVRAALESYAALTQIFNQAGANPISKTITMLPKNTIAIDDVETAEKLIKLVDVLEDLDDVQHVYSNADIPEQILQKLV